jgi:hypothetical protein
VNFHQSEGEAIFTILVLASRSCRNTVTVLCAVDKISVFKTKWMSRVVELQQATYFIHGIERSFAAEH